MDNIPYLPGSHNPPPLGVVSTHPMDNDKPKRKRVPLKEIYDKLDKNVYQHFEYLVMGFNYINKLTNVHEDIIGIFDWISPSERQVKLAEETQFKEYLDSSLVVSKRRLPWSVEEECMKPINQQIGFDHIEYLTSIINEMDEPVYGSAWIIAESPAQTFHKDLLLQEEFHPKYQIRGTVKYMGYYGYSEINPLVLWEHQCEMTERFLHHETDIVETKIELTVDIHLNTMLTLNWTTKSENLSFNQVFSDYDDAVIEQCVDPSSQDRIMYLLWNDLLLLEKIRNTITVYGSNVKIKSNLKYSPVIWPNKLLTIFEIKDNILKILNDEPVIRKPAKDKDTLDDVDDDDGEVGNLLEIVLKSFTRKSLQFTDKLWMILKDVPSFEILQLAIDFIYDCVLGGYIHKKLFENSTSKNHLYTLMNALHEKYMTKKPSLNGSIPLELLLDIGLEKLRGDYIYIFKKSKIHCDPNSERRCRCDYPLDSDFFNWIPLTCIPMMKSQKTLNDTYSIISITPSKFVPTYVEGNLSRLMQLHFIITHLVQCPLNLYALDVYNFVIAELIDPGESVKWTMTHKNFKKIHVSLQCVNGLESLETLPNPHEMKITMKTKAPTGFIESTYYFNVKQIFPPDVFKMALDNENLHDSNLCEETQYYGFHYLKVGRENNSKQMPNINIEDVVEPKEMLVSSDEEPGVEKKSTTATISEKTQVDIKEILKTSEEPLVKIETAAKTPDHDKTAKKTEENIKNILMTLDELPAEVENKSKAPEQAKISEPTVTEELIFKTPNKVTPNLRYKSPAIKKKKARAPDVPIKIEQEKGKTQENTKEMSKTSDSPLKDAQEKEIPVDQIKPFFKSSDKKCLLETPNKSLLSQQNKEQPQVDTKEVPITSATPSKDAEEEKEESVDQAKPFIKPPVEDVPTTYATPSKDLEESKKTIDQAKPSNTPPVDKKELLKTPNKPKLSPQDKEKSQEDPKPVTITSTTPPKDAQEKEETVDQAKPLIKPPIEEVPTTYATLSKDLEESKKTIDQAKPSNTLPVDKKELLKTPNKPKLSPQNKEKSQEDPKQVPITSATLSKDPQETENPEDQAKPSNTPPLDKKALLKTSNKLKLSSQNKEKSQEDAKEAPTMSATPSKDPQETETIVDQAKPSNTPPVDTKALLKTPNNPKIGSLNKEKFQEDVKDVLTTPATPSKCTQEKERKVDQAKYATTLPVDKKEMSKSPNKPKFSAQKKEQSQVDTKVKPTMSTTPSKDPQVKGKTVDQAKLSKAPPADQKDIPKTLNKPKLSPQHKERSQEDIKEAPKTPATPLKCAQVIERNLKTSDWPPLSPRKKEKSQVLDIKEVPKTVATPAKHVQKMGITKTFDNSPVNKKEMSKTSIQPSVSLKKKKNFKLDTEAMPKIVVTPPQDEQKMEKVFDRTKKPPISPQEKSQADITSLEIMSESPQPDIKEDPTEISPKTAIKSPKAKLD